MYQTDSSVTRLILAFEIFALKLAWNFKVVKKKTR